MGKDPRVLHLQFRVIELESQHPASPDSGSIVAVASQPFSAMGRSATRIIRNVSSPYRVAPGLNAQTTSKSGRDGLTPEAAQRVDGKFFDQEQTGQAYTNRGFLSDISNADSQADGKSLHSSGSSV